MSSIERRILPAEAENNEVEVRREDQDAINAFSRLNNRETNLVSLLDSLESQKSDLEEVSAELELADEDEMVPYKIGDSFIELTVGKVQDLLQEKTEEMDSEINSARTKLDSAREEMETLKIRLYKRFGRSINLER